MNTHKHRTPAPNPLPVHACSHTAHCTHATAPLLRHGAPEPFKPVDPRSSNRSGYALVGAEANSNCAAMTGTVCEHMSDVVSVVESELLPREAELGPGGARKADGADVFQRNCADAGSLFVT